MLIDRLAMSIVLVPAAVWVLALGGPVFTVLILATLILASREYARFFRAGGGRPALPLIMVGVGALVANRYWAWVDQGLLLTGVIVGSLVWHLVDYEAGATSSGTDFVATVGGVLYLGWMGSYMVAIRHHGPDGLWWSAVAFGTVWLADTGANAIAYHTASYEAWLHVCRGNDVVTAVIEMKTGTATSGVYPGGQHGGYAQTAGSRRRMASACSRMPKPRSSA